MKHDLYTPLALPLEWRIDPDCTDYDRAVAVMEARVRAIRGGEAGEMVWLTQHHPVYTAGSSARDSDLLAPGATPIRKVARGGEWTWHGPGQRIGYLMLDVEARGKDVRRFVRQTEEWVILTLRHFGLDPVRRQGLPGVWIRDISNKDNTNTMNSNKGNSNVEISNKEKYNKIAAIGIRLTRWVSWHGMAINLNPDLTAFDGIIPCGVADGGVTSLHREGVTITMAELNAALKTHFNQAFSLTHTPAPQVPQPK